MCKRKIHFSSWFTETSGGAMTRNFSKTEDVDELETQFCPGIGVDDVSFIPIEKEKKKTLSLELYIKYQLY